MERLLKIGRIEPKHSREIQCSRIGIGFEKLDRDAFDPTKAYDPMAQLGVKWARVQSGWQKTERTRGVYDFAWLDDVVDNLLARGIQPWLNLSYGNKLYSPAAETVYGAVGVPPIFTEEERVGWANYVKATVAHFKGRITHYEIWNEPDGQWCWKHGPSGAELGRFTVETAKAIRATDAECVIIGGVICFDYVGFLSDAFEEGMADWIDAISFHKYSPNDDMSAAVLKTLRGVIDRYDPTIRLIQGETGSQSRSDGAGAMKGRAWTPRRQAKQLLRQTMMDLFSEVLFCSYFSCMDMKEALGGRVGERATYRDFGYFGLLSAQFDEEGNAIGEVTPKPSYYAMQNLCALFSGNCRTITPPVYVRPETCLRVDGSDVGFSEIKQGGFLLDDGTNAYVYWRSCDLLTTEFEGTMTIEVCAEGGTFRLADLYTGDVYEIPKDMIVQTGRNGYKLCHLPIKDYPLALLY